MIPVFKYSSQPLRRTLPDPEKGIQYRDCLKDTGQELELLPVFNIVIHPEPVDDAVAVKEQGPLPVNVQVFQIHAVPF